MNSKVLRLGAAIAILGTGIWTGTQLVSNAEGETLIPGSADDPVVTKSYVDKVAGGGNNGAAEAQKQLQAMIDKFKAELENQPKPEAGIKSEVVLVKPGQTLVAAAGSQFVIRAGKGLAYSSDTNGISDVTGGVDIKNGQPVPNNHLIIFPREGRGLTLDSASPINLTVLVLGGYELK